MKAASPPSNTSSSHCPMDAFAGFPTACVAAQQDWSAGSWRQRNTPAEATTYVRDGFEERRVAHAKVELAVAGCQRSLQEGGGLHLPHINRGRQAIAFDIRLCRLHRFIRNLCGHKLPFVHLRAQQSVNARCSRPNVDAFDSGGVVLDPRSDQIQQVFQPVDVVQPHCKLYRSLWGQQWCHVHRKQNNNQRSGTARARASCGPAYRRAEPINWHRPVQVEVVLEKHRRQLTVEATQSRANVNQQRDDNHAPGSVWILEVNVANAICIQRHAARRTCYQAHNTTSRRNQQATAPNKTHYLVKRGYLTDKAAKSGRLCL